MSATWDGESGYKITVFESHNWQVTHGLLERTGAAFTHRGAVRRARRAAKYWMRLDRVAYTEQV